MDQARGLLEIVLYSKAQRVCIIIIYFYFYFILFFFFSHLNSSGRNFERAF